MTFGPILRGAVGKAVVPVRLRHVVQFQSLADQLRRAPALTPDLISKVIADACTRLPALSRAGKTARIERFTEANAWNDAVLALIELELPAWNLRRLVYECSF